VTGEKRPAIPWTEYQQRRPYKGELVEWFHQGDYQIGVVCGEVSGNLVVLDFETPESYREWAGRHRALATTRTVETGKGVHVYFKLNKKPDGNTKLITGLVETRGEGGQVLAPPSLHPSGRHYSLMGKERGILQTTWDDIARGESWGKRTKALDKKEAAQTIAFGRAAGERNSALFEAAVLLRDTGTPQPQAIAVLLKANENNDPPLPDGEIKRTVESAYSRPAHNRTEDAIAQTYEVVLKELAAMREEQAQAFLKQITDPNYKLDFAPRVRDLINRAGALTEIQIQQIIDEIERNPPLVERKRTEFLRIWRIANKRIREAIAGKATDDEIADAYKAQYDPGRMFTRDRWWRYDKSGVWVSDCDAQDEIWRMLIEFKDADVRPTDSKARSVEKCLQGRSWLGIQEHQVDARHEWLNLLNGVYDLTTGEIIPHAPEQYLTTQLPFEYDPLAECPLWEKFLSEVLVRKNGETSQEMAAFIQQAFGYSLTAWTKYELSFWLQGSGSNGKSTLIHILTKLTGTASRALNLGMLEKDPYQLAELPGKRVVTCTESPIGMLVADSLIKSLVSGDTLSVRSPYGKPFELEPICKIWWAMNNPPRVADASEGFWRKVRITPFYAHFDGAHKDVNLRFKLEQELSGIFNWALAGLRSLEQNGWLECDEIKDATDAYRDSNDVEQAFVTECCVTGADELGNEYRVNARALYKAYKEWCFETGHRPKTMTRVAGDWLRLGFSKKRYGSGFDYLGVGLLSDLMPM
jgi:P4 family phage/plasmid primase-like protien